MLTAYFCAEFGVDSNLPSYAGGLGILAGDTMLEAGVSDYPLIGIGLLYQGKRFLQNFSHDGWQDEYQSPFHAENTSLVRPLEKNGEPIILSFEFFNEKVNFMAYQQKLGSNTTLYFLTSDVDGNSEYWRDIMQAEYYGDYEMQIRQQMLLGIGGVILLKALNLNPDVYHFQEGRPIFAHWELTRDYMKKYNFTWEASSKEVIKQIVYTNHTLVPDGNLVYPIEIIHAWASDFSKNLNIDPKKLYEDGVTLSGFSITRYALENSNVQSAVSKLHSELCQKTWPKYKWKYVTNGVHLPRWQDVFFANNNLANKDIWEKHLEKKRYLARTVKKRSGFSYDPERLIIGWARRITAYKQIDMIFCDIKRLENIVKNADKPVQIIMAGKSHPGDDYGKKAIQNVMKQMTEYLSGHALFVPNYDIALAYRLVGGVDVWLNTPEYGHEACGTSGMKAASNGVVNLTARDGWAYEVDWELENCGFAIDYKRYSESIYENLEQKIIPIFYERDENNIPQKWIEVMKNSINLSKKYSTERMLLEYQKKLYKF